MKITDISYETYAWARNAPIRNGRHTWTDTQRCVIRVRTDEGVDGIGIGGAWAGESEIREAFRPLLIGQDPLMIGHVVGLMNDSKVFGRRGHESHARSGLDLALWDLLAKVAGMPLHRLLGAHHARVPFYIAGGYYGRDKSHADLQREMVGYAATGARGVKMKVGGASITEDAARVRAVREAIGPDMHLMLDANCAYRPHEAVRFAARVEEYDILWLEEPVGPDDYAGYRQVADKIAVPLAGGEQEYGVPGFRDLIATRALTFVQPDARWMGGVTEFMKVATMADAQGLLISSHGDQQTHTGLMCAIPNNSYAEFYAEAFDPHHRDFYATPVERTRDGYVLPSMEPGGGWAPNEEFCARLRVA